jgi:hypothetical protein
MGLRATQKAKCLVVNQVARVSPIDFLLKNNKSILSGTIIRGTPKTPNLSW